MKTFALTTGAVFAALTLHSYLNAPWFEGRHLMGTRVNCIAHHIPEYAWNLPHCL